MHPKTEIDRRGLGRIKREFEKWRARKGVRKLPESLWDHAVRLARKHGVDEVARELRLEAQALHGRMGTGERESRSERRALGERPSLPPTAPVRAPGFVEIGSTPASSLGIAPPIRGEAIRLSRRGASGRGLKIQLPVGAMMDWEAFFRAWMRADHATGKASAPAGRVA